MTDRNKPFPPARVIARPDGTFETVSATPVPTQEELAEAHRQTREIIEGNVQFHDDPYGAPAQDNHITCKWCGLRGLEEDLCDSIPATTCPRI